MGTFSSPDDTCSLDVIGELEEVIPVELLRLLQDRRFVRMGTES